MAASCSRRLTVPDVVGVYTVKLPGGIEKLTLHGGGQFLQDIEIRGGQRAYHANGKWKFNENHRYIVFDGNLLSALDARGRLLEEIRPKTNRIVVLGVGKVFGSVTIFVSDNQVYRKIAQ